MVVKACLNALVLRQTPPVALTAAFRVAAAAHQARVLYTLLEAPFVPTTVGVTASSTDCDYDFFPNPAFIFKYSNYNAVFKYSYDNVISSNSILSHLRALIPAAFGSLVYRDRHMIVALRVRAKSRESFNQFLIRIRPKRCGPTP